MTMPSSSLALTHRPHSFSDIVGQKSVSLILEQMVLKDAVPDALLLRGSRGTGKTTTARVLAAALNCEIKPGPCGSCVSCRSVFDGTSLDVLEIDAASNGLVADIRALREQVLYSVSGRKRIVVLDEVQMMSREAFNALLKVLEEPPSDTVFILITTEPTKIPDTVLSRCMEFVFSHVPVKDIISRLQHICECEDLIVEPGLLTSIAEYANGGLRDAVMVLDQVTRVGVRAERDFRELFGLTDFAPCVLSALLASDTQALFACVDAQLARTGDAKTISIALVHLLRDLLVLKSGGPVARQGEALAVRQRLCQQLAAESMVAILQVLWKLKTEVRAGDDQADLSLALMVISDTLSKNQPKPTESNRRLSLQEMQAMTSAVA